MISTHDKARLFQQCGRCYSLNSQHWFSISHYWQIIVFFSIISGLPSLGNVKHKKGNFEPGGWWKSPGLQLCSNWIPKMIFQQIKMSGVNVDSRTGEKTMIRCLINLMMLFPLMEDYGKRKRKRKKKLTQEEEARLFLNVSFLARN